MTRALHGFKAALGRFGRDQSGTSTVQYVLMIPLVFAILLLALDSGLSTMRAALMDRAMDMTARSIRNGTLASPTIGNIRTDLCARMTMFPNCATTLKVQIYSVERATFTMPATTPACADSGSAVAPVRRYTPGGASNLAVVRACMEISTFTPTGLIGRPSLYRFYSATVVAGTAS